jgi:hypothetical protein
MLRYAGLKIFLRSIFDFNLKLDEVALSWLYHEIGGEDESKKYF